MSKKVWLASPICHHSIPHVSPLTLSFVLLQRDLFPQFPLLIVFWHITISDPPQRSLVIHFWCHCLVVELEEGCTLGECNQDWQWDINSFIVRPFYCNHEPYRFKIRFSAIYDWLYMKFCCCVLDQFSIQCLTHQYLKPPLLMDEINAQSDKTFQIHDLIRTDSFSCEIWEICFTLPNKWHLLPLPSTVESISRDSV